MVIIRIPATRSGGRNSNSNHNNNYQMESDVPHGSQDTVAELVMHGQIIMSYYTRQPWDHKMSKLHKA